MGKLLLLEDKEVALLKSILAMHWEIGDEDHNALAGVVHNRLLPGDPLPDVPETKPEIDVDNVLRCAEEALAEGQENVTGSSTTDQPGDDDSTWCQPLKLVRELMVIAEIPVFPIEGALSGLVKP